MIKPYNDNILVEIGESSPFAGSQQQATETGIVVAIPEKINYFSFHSFGFENSFMADSLKELLADYKKLQGKRVYWTSYSERGSVMKIDDKTYALLRFTDIIAVEDDPKAKPAKSIEVSQNIGVTPN